MKLYLGMPIIYYTSGASGGRIQSAGFVAGIVSDQAKQYASLAIMTYLGMWDNVVGARFADPHGDWEPEEGQSYFVPGPGATRRP